MDTRQRIKQCIVTSLELDRDADSIPSDAILFAPAIASGLELDSLAALEIIVALNREFDLQLDEIPRESFMSVDTLADYIDQRLATEGAPEQIGGAPEQ